MGLLDRFEQRVDRAVNGAFAKAFKSELQPVEIAAALQNEMDARAAVVSRARTVVPNVYTVLVSQEDYDRLSVYDEALVGEFAIMIRDYAQQQQYSFLGSVSVAMQPADDRPQGTVEIVSEARVDHDVAPAAGPPAGAAPRLEGKRGTFQLTRAITRIGRGADADIRIDDPGVSRHHAEIRIGNDVILRDLDSTNGTYINGMLVAEQPLRDGAVITIGSTNLTFRSAV
ncbi:MAG: FHA domain-containing protein [Micrococcales bacterium]|nr:FHA domain-containing protein [Micrococcales bacterium]